MRILQINKYYYPDIGGVESVVKQYAESIDERFNVTVLCVKKDFSTKTSLETINGVNVIRCASFGTFFSMPVSLVFILRFLRCYKQFDILHFHEPFPLASLLSLIIGKKNKIIITWHSDIIKQKLLKKSVEVFQRKLCRKANVVTTTSPNMLEFSDILREFRNKVSILPLSIPTKRSISKSDNNYILYLGRLSYYKGIDVLLKAYEIADTNMELRIVGGGDKEIAARVSEQCKITKKNIVFVNSFVTEEEKNQLFKNCSFFVLPSIAASEAFAIIQLEAMIYGKAVINTNLPTGVPYVSVHNSTGLTVTPNDHMALANAIDQLALDTNLRKKLGEKGHERVVSKFSDHVIIRKLEELYLEMVK